MKERIDPWGEARAERVEGIPLRHLEQGVLGMHEILELYPGIRIGIDPDFNALLERRLERASAGCEKETDGWRRRRHEAYVAFVEPLEDRAATIEEHARVKELVDRLVDEWRSIARHVKPASISFMSPEQLFMRELLGSAEVRRGLWNLGCRALKPMYDALRYAYAVQALDEKGGEFYLDYSYIPPDDEDARGDAFDAMYERACAAYDAHPEDFMGGWGVSPEYLDFYHETIDGSNPFESMLAHVMDQLEVEWGCQCAACTWFPDEALFVDVFRELGGVIFRKDFGVSDDEREVIVAMFAHHVREQRYTALEQRARALTELIPGEMEAVGRFFREWCAVLVGLRALDREEADGLMARVERAMDYVGRHARAVNADEMASDLACFDGMYIASEHLILVRDHPPKSRENYDADMEEFVVEVEDQGGHDAHTIRHELFHALSGHGMLSRDDDDEIDVMQVGLNKYHRFAWFNEAFTEFLNMCASQHVKGETYDIKAALRDGSIYGSARKLLSCMLVFAEGAFHPLMGRMMLAYFEDVGGERPVRYFNDMNRMIADVYGSSFLVRLDDCINRATYQKQLEDHTITWDYGVEAVLDKWEAAIAAGEGNRFAREYIAGGGYMSDFPKLPKKKKAPQ